MNRQITLYSFSDRDRSGKIRWTANELGYLVNEVRVDHGEHRQDEYAAVNPYRQIPAVKIDDEFLIESTAVCINLAERHPESGLIPPAGDPLRPAFWQQVVIATQTLEFQVVNYILSKSGLVDEAWGPLLEERLHASVEVFKKNVPGQEWWLGEAFTLTDIFAAYVLRIAVQSGLIEYRGALKNWFERLIARPAAQKAKFFSGFPEQ